MPIWPRVFVVVDVTGESVVIAVCFVLVVVLCVVVAISSIKGVYV